MTLPYNPGNKGYMPVPRLAEITGVPKEAIDIQQYRTAAVLPFCTSSFRAKNDSEDARVNAEIEKSFRGKKHRVYPYSVDNEKLEFHGDALLRVFVAEYLLAKYPDKDEQFYSYVRINCEKKTSLALFSREWGLNKYIVLSKDAEKLRMSVHVIEDVFEAFVSGVYFAFGYSVAKNFVIRTLEATKLDFIEDTNYKNKIISAGTLAKSTTATYTMPPAIASLMSSGDHKNGVLFYDRRTGKCIGAATGTSAKSANELASKQAAEFVEAVSRGNADVPVSDDVSRFEAAYKTYVESRRIKKAGKNKCRRSSSATLPSSTETH